MSCGGHCGSEETQGRPDCDNLSDLLQCAAISARLDTLRYLLELGANANDKANGGSSALDTSLWHLHFGSFEALPRKRLRSRYDVHKALECVEELVAHGAAWRPDRAEINSLRRALYGCEPSVTIDLMKLFLEHNACPRDAVQELLGTPRMKQHLSTETRNLSRAGLRLEDGQNKKRQRPPPTLLARYNRAELYEKALDGPDSDRGETLRSLRCLAVESLQGPSRAAAWSRVLGEEESRKIGSETTAPAFARLNCGGSQVVLTRNSTHAILLANCWLFVCKLGRSAQTERREVHQSTSKTSGHEQGQ